MLKSYSAELNGSQLTWLDEPPKKLTGQPVLVVIEDAPSSQASAAKPYDLADLVGRLTWNGDATAAQRRQRDAW